MKRAKKKAAKKKTMAPRAKAPAWAAPAPEPARLMADVFMRPAGSRKAFTLAMAAANVLLGFLGEMAQGDFRLSRMFVGPDDLLHIEEALRAGSLIEWELRPMHQGTPTFRFEGYVASVNNRRAAPYGPDTYDAILRLSSKIHLTR